MGNDCRTDGTKSRSEQYVPTNEKDHHANVGRQHGQSNEGMSGNRRNGKNRQEMQYSKGGQNTAKYGRSEEDQHMPSQQRLNSQPGGGHAGNPIGVQYHSAQNSHDVKGDKKKKDQNQASLSEINAYLNEERKQSDTLRQEIEYYKKNVDQLKNARDETRDRLNKELGKKEGEIKLLQDRYRTTSDTHGKKIAALRQDLDKMKKERDSLLTRYSALAGSKLTDGNANIADLSDENRPTKIAEQYTELYDNEWTDAFTVLSADKTRSNEDICHTIAKAFCITYITARQEADNDLKNFVNAMKLFLKTDTLPSEVLKDVKDRRKKKPGGNSDTIRKLYSHDMKTILSYEEQKQVSTFLKKSIDICWLMAIQDPPLYVGTDLSLKNEQFNTNYFKPYTATGKFIDFIVWPTLYLHEGGSVLSKGIAQGMKSRGEIKHYDNVEIKRDTAMNGRITSTISSGNAVSVVHITNSKQNIVSTPDTNYDKRGNNKENAIVSNTSGKPESSFRHKSKDLDSENAIESVSLQGEGHKEKTNVPSPGPANIQETNSRTQSHSGVSHSPSANRKTSFKEWSEKNSNVNTKITNDLSMEKTQISHI